MNAPAVRATQQRDLDAVLEPLEISGICVDGVRAHAHLSVALVAKPWLGDRAPVATTPQGAAG